MSKKPLVRKSRIFTYLYGFAGPYLFPLVFGVLLFSSQLVMFPLMSSMLFGGVTEAVQLRELSALFVAAYRVLGMLLLTMAVTFFGVLLTVINATKTFGRLQRKVLHHFMKTGAEDQTHSGERLSRLNTDVLSARHLYSDALINFLSFLQPMLVISAVIFSIEWRIGTITIIVGLISIGGQILFAKPLSKIAKKSLETTAEATKLISDIFSGAIVIRVFRLEKLMSTMFNSENETLKRLVYREARIDGGRRLIAGLSSLLSTGGVFAVGTILVYEGVITLTTLMALIPLCAIVADSIGGIGGAWAGMQEPLEAGMRIHDLLDGDNKIQPLYDAQIINKVAALDTSDNAGSSLDVKNLTFRYHNAEKPTLENVNFSVGENQLAIFVGESGCGKSTLLKVIAGLYKTQNGEISVGRSALDGSDLEKWRTNFAYVEQNSTLFNLTIYENIALGIENATFEDVKAAAVDVGADEFVMTLPDGYDTQVGEVGSNLSGGQKQRIAIARALLRNSPILVLDEVTSALDAESEKDVLDTISKLREKRTILLITHNPDAIKADAVFEVKNGSVAKQQ